MLNDFQLFFKFHFQKFCTRSLKTRVSLAVRCTHSHLPFIREPTNTIAHTLTRPPWERAPPRTSLEFQFQFQIPACLQNENLPQTYLSWSYTPEAKKMKIRSTEEKIHQGGEDLLEEEINICGQLWFRIMMISVMSVWCLTFIHYLIQEPLHIPLLFPAPSSASPLKLST